MNSKIAQTASKTYQAHTSTYDAHSNRPNTLKHWHTVTKTFKNIKHWKHLRNLDKSTRSIEFPNLESVLKSVFSGNAFRTLTARSLDVNECTYSCRYVTVTALSYLDISWQYWRDIQDPSRSWQQRGVSRLVLRWGTKQASGICVCCSDLIWMAVVYLFLVHEH